MVELLCVYARTARGTWPGAEERTAQRHAIRVIINKLTPTLLSCSIGFTVSRGTFPERSLGRCTKGAKREAKSRREAPRPSVDAALPWLRRFVSPFCLQQVVRYSVIVRSRASRSIRSVRGLSRSRLGASRQTSNPIAPTPVRPRACSAQRCHDLGPVQAAGHCTDMANTRSELFCFLRAAMVVRTCMYV